MAVTLSTKASESPDVMARLGELCQLRGLPGLGERLQILGEIAGEDLMWCEAELEALPRLKSPVFSSASHLLDLGGKRLRPLCVALAARAGDGFGAAARELAVAVELVHSATLLHDDVVDLGTMRRGAPTARSVYGNAASIFAGDWLLIEALRRVRAARVAGALDRLLEVIGEMIAAESTQLENRGRIDVARETYFRVVEGKTAALFRWAMFAGARAGGLGDAASHALERYGLHLGVAFQAIDDLLDLTGGTATGKTLFADLREGKMTYPLICAVEHDAGLVALLEEIVATPADRPIGAELVERVRGVLRQSGSIEDCRALARARAADAVRALAGLPPSAAKTALATVAEAAVERDR